MMITKISNLFCGCLLCGGMAVALTSCDKMLDTTSELVEFEEDNTLNHPTDSVYSVLGIVNCMQHIADRTVLLGEVRADLVGTTEAASADLKRLSAFDFSKDNKYNRISDYYAVINNCNFYLAHVDTAMQRRGRTLFIYEYAAVKAYRAWTYLELVKNYGSVPLVTEPLMTEREATAAMNGPRKGMKEICDYFVGDLTPFALTKQPRFGNIGSWNSDLFFIPVRPLLGDLCLWSGHYEEAARWYNSYLNDKEQPVRQNYSSRIYWNNPSEFQYPVDGYYASGSNEVLSIIPMEQRIFDGNVSDLQNVFCSTRENNYFYQLTPSSAMYRLSASQVNCLRWENTSTGLVDTIYVPQTGLSENYYVGDLRLSSNFRQSSIGGQDPYSDLSSIRQTISKITRWENLVPTYRTTMVYLRYAEALNRAGLPQSAMTVLKYGICQENITNYVDSIEQLKAGDLITFDATEFTRETTRGIHSRGSGDSECNLYYVLPLPEQPLATRQDTINWQVPRVEDLIVNEMALEGAFEGYRFYDLMRVALRRSDPDYLAAPISRRNGTEDPQLHQLLMDANNWYLPIK